MKTKKLVRCALIAAVYAALCIVLQPLSYNLVQVRVAEMLCLLPVFGTDYIIGVTLGCFMANLLGTALGTTVAVDVLFGTFATLLGCVLTWLLRGMRIKGLAIPASIPPVVSNALIIGAELSFFFTDSALTGPIVAMNMVTVGIGEAISCCVLGVALVRLIENNRRLRQLFIEA